MGPNNTRGFAHSRLKMAAAVCAGLSVMGGVAAAQISAPNAPLKLQTDYLGYAASASPRVGYSDNISLQRGPLKDDEYFLSTMFTGGAIVSTQRVTAIILGDLDFSFLIDQGDFAVNQDIGATSTFTAVDNWLYLDVSGSTTRQLLGDNARFSSNINAARGQRANVHSYSASPYVYHQLPNLSTVELRYRFSQVFVDDSNTGFNLFSGTSRNDSKSNEVTARYQSGGLLDRVRVGITAYGNDTTEEGSGVFPDFGYRQGSISSDAQIALSTQFALTGAVGYDEVEAQDAAVFFFNEGALSGVFWRAGFSAQPGPRSRVRLEYGQRYNDDFIDAEIFYELSERLVFSAAASRSFRTRAQSVSSQYNSTQRQTLEFADRLREGEELSARGVIRAANFIANGLNGFSAQTTGVAVSDSAYASLTGVYGRTELLIRGAYSDDDFGFRQIETYGAGINIRRRLSRRMTGYGNVSFRRADTTVDTATCEANPLIFGFDPTDPLFDAAVQCANLTLNNGVTNTVIGQLGGAYRLFENASAFAEYSYSERFAPNALLEYSENSIIVGVTVDFN